MATYRVLWSDQDGGYWGDVNADDEAHAIWQTAAVVGNGRTFVAIAELPAPPGD